MKLSDQTLKELTDFLSEGVSKPIARNVLLVDKNIIVSEEFLMFLLDKYEPILKSRVEKEVVDKVARNIANMFLKDIK